MYLNSMTDQFYLVDFGFPNMFGYLSPFLSARYHLLDFCDRGQPRGKQELFNYRHSSLRNVIKKCFGALKAKFPILKLMSITLLEDGDKFPLFVALYIILLECNMAKIYYLVIILEKT